MHKLIGTARVTAVASLSLLASSVAVSAALAHAIGASAGIA